VTFGHSLVISLLILSALSFLLYLISIDAAPGWAKAARFLQWVKAVVAGLAVFYLGTLFMHNVFTFKYVYENSSTTQELLYKISAIWAGQEGTFLLWLFMLSFIGAAAAGALREYEGRAMIFMSVLEFSLCAVLLNSDPFALVKEGMGEGLGMNPLLRNPWMAIHPPVVFAGYALAAAPFIIFLAGVWKGETFAWARKALPWAVLSWAVLGAGIFLGSYWAYEVLGWGGFWGWDPVENASLFPWIALGALVHGIILQSYKKKFVIWNGIMVTAAYVMVLYSTFLTRSGILSDFSVHSFQGGELLVPLTLLLAIGAIPGIITIILHVRQVRAASETDNSAPQGIGQLLIYWTVAVFWLFFFFVFTGTNFPLFSKYLAENPTPLQPHYYNVTSTAVGIPFAVILFLCPLFVFRRKSGAKGLPVPQLIAGAAVGIFAAALCIASGVRNPAALVLAGLGGAAVLTQAIPFVSGLFGGKRNFPAYLAHVGVALLLVGFVSSSLGTKSERFAMRAGDKAKFAGAEIKLMDVIPFQHGYKAHLEINNGKTFTTKLEFVSQEAQGAAVSRPVIHGSLVRDIYITPNQVVESGMNTGDGESGRIDLKKGVAAELGETKIIFENFDLERMKQGMVGINLTVENKGRSQKLTPFFGQGPEGMTSDEVLLKEDGLAFRVIGIDPAEKTATIEWVRAKSGEKHARPQSSPTAVFQISVKPFMTFVWAGFIILSAGVFLAAANRLRKSL